MGPAQRLTMEISAAHAKDLIREIRSLDPTFRIETLEPGGFPSTTIGQTNLINRLRLERAKAYYNKGEVRPLQVETLRFLQRSVDATYDLGVIKLAAGQLRVRLSQHEALGNFIDTRVRREQRRLYNQLGISIEKGQLVQVNRRTYHVPEGSFSRPDSRVGNIAFDVSLTAKNLSTPQVRNFFRSDIQPSAVVIVRPSQLGPYSSYIITKPSGR